MRGDVLAGVEAEILVARQRRNLAETVAPQKDRHRTQRQVQMLGVRNQRQEDQQRQRVQPPHLTRGHGVLSPNHKPPDR